MNDEPTTITTTELPPLRVAEGDDFLAMYNARRWLQKAMEAKGAKVTGSGCGGLCADIDFELEGCRFNVVLTAK